MGNRARRNTGDLSSTQGQHAVRFPQPVLGAGGGGVSSDLGANRREVPGATASSGPEGCVVRHPLTCVRATPGIGSKGAQEGLRLGPLLVKNTVNGGWTRRQEER